MDTLEFCKMVNDPEVMSQYPMFLAAYVIPNRIAFLQVAFEVKGMEIGTETMTMQEWLNDDYRRRMGWPQAIEAAQKIFEEQYYHE